MNTVRHLVERGELTEGWQFRPDEFLEYVGQQFGVAFPLYLVGMFVAFIAPDIRRHFTTAYRFLLCMSAPLYLFYTFLALNDKGQPNWTVPSLVGGLVIMTAYWLRRSDESRPWRRTATVTLCLAGLVVVGFLVSTRFRMPTRRDPLVRARGSRDLAAQVVAQADEHTADFILGANYQVASLLTFYLPDHPAVYPPHSKRIKNQFAFWPSYGEAQRGQTALYVSKGEWVPPELTQEFARVELIEKTQTRFKGKRVRDFYFYLCEDYSGRAQPDHNRKARP